MPIIQKVLITEACPFEHDRFPDSKRTTIVVECEHIHCFDNDDGLCESGENVWKIK